MSRSLRRCSATCAASSKVQWTLTFSARVLSSFIRRSRQVQSFTLAAPRSRSSIGVAIDLLPQRDRQTLPLGDPPIAGGKRIPISLAQRGDPDRS